MTRTSLAKEIKKLLACENPSVHLKTVEMALKLLDQFPSEKVQHTVTGLENVLAVVHERRKGAKNGG